MTTDLRDELMSVIENAITNHPRSLQKRVGPSEIGHPCAAKLAYKLAGTEPLNSGRIPWKPTIGTAVHSWMEETFHGANKDLPGYDATGGRYWCEVRVDVGEIGGETITGSCDLYFDGTVVDFKVVGDDQLRKYKKNGPGDQYRVQAHLYGRGWQRRGEPVKTVAVLFLPRNQELQQAYLWTEPYNEQVAVDALTRADGIASLVAALGPAAAGLLPKAESWCRYCDYFKPGSTTPGEGCTGVVTMPDPKETFTGILP